MVRSKSLVCLLAILMVGVHAGAQQITGSIRGSVQDPSSAFVQSASVSARQTETGLTRTRDHRRRWRLCPGGIAGRPL